MRAVLAFILAVGFTVAAFNLAGNLVGVLTGSIR